MANHLNGHLVFFEVLAAEFEEVQFHFRKDGGATWTQFTGAVTREEGKAKSSKWVWVDDGYTIRATIDGKPMATTTARAALRVGSLAGSAQDGSADSKFIIVLKCSFFFSNFISFKN